MDLRTSRFSTLTAPLFAILTFAVVLLFIITAAWRPMLVARQAGRMERLFSDASSLQTLRIYLERVHAAQEGLWLGASGQSNVTYLGALAEFNEHLAPITRYNPQAARQIRPAYVRYVAETLRARAGDTRIPPRLLSADYTRLEDAIFTRTQRAYRRAFGEQDSYRAFTRNLERSTQLLSLGVALATLLLLALSQWYRVRLQRSAEERISLLVDVAMKDALTGLRNLRAFEEDLTKAAAVAMRCNNPVSLMLLDVDGFKEINDRFGHPAGDALLKSVSARLKGLREADSVYRLGGDEFAIILAGTAASGAQTAAQRILTPITEDAVPVTLSAGIAQLRAGEVLADWRQRSDIALYEAKRRGGNQAVAYASIEGQANFVSTQAVSRVRRLLEEGTMDMAFQPIWDRSSGSIFGFEALARPSVKYGFSGPQELFDAAQRIGHIVELDQLCLRSALAAALENRLDSRIFVNVTPATLEHPLFRASALAEMAARHGFKPDAVVIEITERSIRDMDAIVRNVEQLRTYGFRIALDDVGSGSAGLSVLSALTFDFVKIDRHLLLNGKAPKARAVLTGILAIADSIGAYLIAEGIETPALLEFAATFHREPPSQRSGIRGYQGYLLGRPHILTPERNADALFGDAPACLQPVAR